MYILSPVAQLNVTEIPLSEELQLGKQIDQLADSVGLLRESSETDECKINASIL